MLGTVATSDDELQALYDRFRNEGAHHEAAEVAFAAAVRCQDKDQRFRWRGLCLDALTGIDTYVLEEVCSVHISIAGVLIPEYLHEGVVEKRIPVN